MAYLPSDLILPEALFGSYAQVMRAWRPIFRRALRDRTWKRALQDVAYLTLEERPEDLVTNFPARYRPEGDAWQLCIVHDLVFKAKLESVEASNAAHRALNWDGLKYPWYLLCGLCSQGFTHPGPAQERKRFAINALDAILEWWDCFCIIDDRFCGDVPVSCRGWPRWAYRVGPLLLEAGVPREVCRPAIAVGPEAAGNMIRSWVEDGILLRPADLGT